MEFRILGPVEVWDADRSVGLGGPKARTVLAILLLQAGQVVSTDRLIDQLWGERAPRSSVNMIQGFVAQLRRSLRCEPDGRASGCAVTTRPPGYLLQIPPGALDLHRFEDLLAEARAAMDEAAPGQAADRLRGALALWRGSALDGVVATPSIQTAALKLEELRATAIEERVDADLLLGRHRELVGELQALTAALPLRERLRGQLMVALYRSDRQAEALRAYQDIREVLVEDLGVEPGAELQQLQRAILTADPSLALPERTRVDAGRRPPVPAQLPPDVATFVGRGHELERLRALLDGLDRHRPVVISAIGGAAGIGKSALAVHLAHELAGRFPDGQLYANLHGATAGLAPLEPLEVLGRFLRALGVDREQIPAGLEEAAALFRSLAAGKRLLVVLDDAATVNQVRPLLPAGPGCGALVTSRQTLASLDGAGHLQLGVLDPAEAVALLGHLAGPARIAAEPDSADALVGLCGHLPLAVRIAGARLAARPAWTVQTLLRRLAASHRRLDELAVGDQAVRASFEVSYQSLRTVGRPGESSDAGLFRLLGLLDLPDVTAPVAAVLVKQPPVAAEEALERLVDGHLLETPTPGRYRMHDLLRLFARERCTAEEPEAVRVKALNRTLRWYLAVATRASRLLYPADQRRVARVDVPEDPMPLHGRAEALAWLEAERVNLLAAARQAASNPCVPPEVVGHLATALFRFLETRGSWHDLAALNQLALQTACRVGDLHGEAQALNDLAATHYRLGRLDQAVVYSEQTLTIRRKLGDRVGEGQALSNLGVHWHAVGQLDRALACYDQSLTILRQAGEHASVGRVLGNLGGVYQDLGRFDDAVACFEQAIAIHHDVGDAHSAGRGLGNLGDLYHQLGRFDDAVACFEQAIAIHHDVGDRYSEGVELKSLGAALDAHGRHHRARACWSEALAIFQPLDMPEADEVLALLDAMDRSATGRP
ncbi:MAG TPA: tetratricopeptide repeat protein [Actinomycetota bacterium]|nr:tetratricopeptide repeat protein [Actinomycetota bacterium]